MFVLKCIDTAFFLSLLSTVLKSFKRGPETKKFGDASGAILVWKPPELRFCPDRQKRRRLETMTQTPPWSLPDWFLSATTQLLSNSSKSSSVQEKKSVLVLLTTAVSCICRIFCILCNRSRSRQSTSCLHRHAHAWCTWMVMCFAISCGLC